MNKPIYIVAGNKGGVGKSIVTMALLDYLKKNGNAPLFIETDTTNPDVWKSHKNTMQSTVLELDDADGWIQLINYADSNPHCPIVINTAARNNHGVERYGKTLGNTLKELDRELITMWVINRQRDSLELLLDYMDALPEGKVHVLKNTYFGEDYKFELYNNSNTRTEIESKGGKSLTVADLADRVSDDLYSKRLSIADAIKELPLGNRAELLRWRAEMGRMFLEVVT